MMHLTQEEQDMLNGARGETVRKCMKVLVTLGEIYGADHMIEVKNVHTPGVSYRVAGDAGLGYVPQGRDIFPQMTVQENLELALYAQKKHGKVPDYIYDLFPILPKFAARRGGDLSGGQQQQLAIARALVADPKVLILDEPTEGIQPSVIADIGTAIQRVNKELGLTVLLVEQYLDFVLENTTQLHVMEKGALIYSSATAEADGAYVQRLMTA